MDNEPSEQLTIFSFGYWGWGSSTRQLIDAVDAVEAARHYEPPVFVDIRLSRSVRASGFNGNAFEKLVGESRYRWMDDLGNLGIQDGGPIRMKNPAAAETLLDLADDVSRKRQRVIFFCACEFPNHCHRSVVTELLLKEASKRGRSIEVVEWPGGDPDPTGIELPVASESYGKVRSGAAAIPLDDPVSLADVAATPWLTLCGVYDPADEEKGEILVLTGPALYKKARWHLPIHEYVADDLADEQIAEHIRKLRETTLLSPRRSIHHQAIT